LHHQGIFIDIFPVNYIAFPQAWMYHTMLNIAKIFCNRYVRIDIIAKWFIKKLNRFHSLDNDYIVSGGENMNYVTHVQKGIVFPLQMLKFEGTLVPAPQDTDTYLSSIFGVDYMTPPPEDKRKIHSIYINTQEPCAYENRKKI